MKVLPVKQPKLFNSVETFLLKCLLENDSRNISETKKLSEYIEKYTESFRDLWVEYED